MLAFTSAIFFLLITPGPGVLSLAGVGAAYGYRPALIYMAGLFVGTNLVALAVVSGLAAIAFSIPWLRSVLLFASVAYLCYLAAKIALSGSKISFIDATHAPGFLGGITLQAINPKAYVVNTTLFTGFAFYPENLFVETLLKFLIINLFWISIHILWMMIGVKLRSLNLAPQTHFKINVGMALAMLAVVGLALYNQL